MQDWAESFYKSKTWQACRATVWSRDGGLCQDCLKAGRIRPAEIVHHITELTPENIGNPKVSLNIDGLISLCRECHAVRHGARLRRYKVDDFGRVTIL